MKNLPVAMGFKGSTIKPAKSLGNIFEGIESHMQITCQISAKLTTQKKQFEKLPSRVPSLPW